MDCIICGKEIKGRGNDVDPIKNEEGRLFDKDFKCCDECNMTFVVPYRVAQCEGKLVLMKNIQRQVNILRKKDRLFVRVQRNDYSTFDQEIEFVDNDVEKSIKQYEDDCLGPDYTVVRHWFKGGND